MPIRKMKMKCKQAKILISSAIDGEISDRERRSLESHLSACEACRAEQMQLRQLRQTMALWADEEPPVGLGETFAARLNSLDKEEGLPSRARWQWAFGTAAAGMAAVLLLGAFLVTSRLQFRPLPETNKPTVVATPTSPPAEVAQRPKMSSQEAATVPSTSTTHMENQARSPNVPAVTSHGATSVSGGYKAVPRISRNIRTRYRPQHIKPNKGTAPIAKGVESRTDPRELLTMIATAGTSSKEAPSFVVASLGETGLAMNEAIEIVRGTLRKAVDQLRAREVSSVDEGGTL